MSRRYEAWREALLDGLALLEAEIDFPDEELPGSIGAASLPGLMRVKTELGAAVEDLRGEHVREGFRVAIIGAPNVGKSSLLNALVRREAAIVTPCSLEPRATSLRRRSAWRARPSCSLTRQACGRRRT